MTIIKTYKCIFMDAEGNDLYIKNWYATSWEAAYAIAYDYMGNTSDDAVDFLLLHN